MIVQCQQSECIHNQTKHCTLDAINISEFNPKCINFVLSDEYKCKNLNCQGYGKAYNNHCVCYSSITQCDKPIT
jgi:hypothetical protein